ncbi:MAG: hypothetical protein JKP98_02810 [Rhodobacteraceae bacterium]|nr:hypothetical protein [Paracoccaceae bacterium]
MPERVMFGRVRGTDRLGLVGIAEETRGQPLIGRVQPAIRDLLDAAADRGLTPSRSERRHARSMGPAVAVPALTASTAAMINVRIGYSASVLVFRGAFSAFCEGS